MKLKFVEIGKVMLVWGILKNVTQVVQVGATSVMYHAWCIMFWAENTNDIKFEIFVFQRVVFLHEDLVKLPSFPR